MKQITKINGFSIVYILPLFLAIIYFLIQSFSFSLHDFSNSYFPAHIVANNNAPETILFDIYEFNNYIWQLGYDEVLADFYLNSPFNATVFYPFTFIEDAYLAKSIFNILGSLLFIISIYYLIKRYRKKALWLAMAIPVIFYVPIRNQVLFGQSYFLVFALIVFSFLFFEKRKNVLGSVFLVLATLLKVFPVVYGLPLLFKKQWKAVFAAILMALILFVASVLLSGTAIWDSYFFEVLPNAIKNKSSIDFHYHAQSMDVFLKTLFIKDPYYNPKGLFDNEQLFYSIKWLIKSVVIGVAIACSVSNKKNIWTVLSIWIVTLFIVQSRTATYAQILWIIPALHIYSSSMYRLKKIIFFIVLFLACNLPIASLESLPLFFKFSRLWLSIILALLFYSSINNKISYKYIGLGFLILLPLHLDMFSKVTKDNSSYILRQKDHFMVYDFNVDGKYLAYNVIGKNGRETKITNIKIDKFNTQSCSLVDNQIMLDGKQITNTPALKKKPVLINECEIYYLTDSRSRRGAFTIKKINVCD